MNKYQGFDPDGHLIIMETSKSNLTSRCKAAYIPEGLMAITVGYMTTFLPGRTILTMLSQDMPFQVML